MPSDSYMTSKTNAARCLWLTRNLHFVLTNAIGRQGFAQISNVRRWPMSVLYRILATVFALLIVFCAAIVCLSFLTRNLPVSDLLIFVISAIFATTTTWLFYKKE